MDNQHFQHPYFDWAHATPVGYYGRVNIELPYYLCSLGLRCVDYAVFLLVYISMQRAKEPQPVIINATELAEKLNCHRNSVDNAIERLINRFHLLQRVNEKKRGQKGAYVVNVDNLFRALDEIRNE